MGNLATIKCLFVILTLPVFLAQDWDQDYRNTIRERQSFRGLPGVLRELYHKHSRDFSPSRGFTTMKRGDRYSINDLIAYLKGMVGSDEIYHTGRSTYVRWGAGG